MEVARKEAGVIAYPPKMADDILAWVKSLYASWVATQSRVMVRHWKGQIKDYKGRLKAEQDALADAKKGGNPKEVRRAERAVQYTQQDIQGKLNEIKEREKVLALAKADGAKGRGKKKVQQDFPVDLTGLPKNYPVDLMTGISKITVTVEFTGRSVPEGKAINGSWNDDTRRLRLILHGHPPEQKYTYVHYIRRLRGTIEHELQHMVQQLFFLFEAGLMEKKLVERKVDWEKLSPQQQQRIRDAIKRGLPREHDPSRYRELAQQVVQQDKPTDAEKRKLYFLDPREFFTWIGNTERDFIETLRMNRKEFIQTIRGEADPDYDPKPTKEEFDLYVGNPRPTKGKSTLLRRVGDPLSTHPFYAALWEYDKPRWRRAVKELWKRVHNKLIMPAPRLPRASAVAERYRARRVARQFLARQFTPESWATYKRKHPGAKEKDHDIVKPQKPTTKTDKAEEGIKLPPAKSIRQKLDRVIQSVSGVSKAVVQSLREAPEKVQKFVVDKSYRDEVTTAAAKAAREAPGKIKKSILESGKSELKAIFKDTPRILASLVKERRAPTKAEAKTLYGVGVYVAGTILAMSGAGAAGAALAGAKAFGHSLGLHIGIKAMNRLADEGFLAYEAVESGATVSGIADALPVNTGNLPGLNQIWDALSTLVTGAEKPEPTMDKMVERLIEIVSEELEQGLTDGDIVEMLKGEQP